MVNKATSIYKMLWNQHKKQVSRILSKWKESFWNIREIHKYRSDTYNDGTQQ